MAKLSATNASHKPVKEGEKDRTELITQKEIKKEEIEEKVRKWSCVGHESPFTFKMYQTLV